MLSYAPKLGRRKVYIYKSNDTNYRIEGEVSHQPLIYPKPTQFIKTRCYIRQGYMYKFSGYYFVNVNFLNMSLRSLEVKVYYRFRGKSLLPVSSTQDCRGRPIGKVDLSKMHKSKYVGAHYFTLHSAHGKTLTTLPFLVYCLHSFTFHVMLLSS